MDAFLSGEASESLEAISLIFKGGPVFGFLIGHKRGHRFFVERALAAPDCSHITAKVFFELDALLEGRIIGFFGQGPGRRVIESMLSPFGLGKLYLEIPPASRKKTSRRSFVMDHERVFYLKPIPLRTDKKESKR